MASRPLTKKQIEVLNSLFDGEKIFNGRERRTLSNLAKRGFVSLEYVESESKYYDKIKVKMIAPTRVKEALGIK